MSELNPYAPPETNPVPPALPGQDQPLATPWRRLGASILDALIMMAIIMPLSWVTGYMSRTMEAAARGVTFHPESILWSAVGLAVMIGINWSALQNGQTIGKRALGLRIVRKDGSPITAKRIITHRLIPVQVAALIPFLGTLAVLVDALLIFRSGRNTLHDDIADTKVIKL